MNMLPSKGANGLSSYNQVAVQTDANTASPHKLIQMLLEAALDKIAKAKGLIANKQIPEKGKTISTVVSIVDALRASLDHSVDGEISGNLDALYEYMIIKLTEANLNNDLNLLDEVSKLLREIKVGWDSIPQEIQAVHESAQMQGQSAEDKSAAG